MKKFLSLLLILVLCLLVAAPGVSYAATVKLTKSKLELRTGDTYTLKLSGASGATKWTSSKKSVVTVSSKGKVKAIKEGKATITATNNKKSYKCSITVKSNKTVDVIYGAYMIDTTSVEGYAANFKEENPDYLDVKVYDEGHIVVTMYESDRLDSLNEFNDNFDAYLSSLIKDESFEGAFTDIKADNLFQNITIYADKDKYESSFAGLIAVLSFGIISDAVQAMNLIDVDERYCNITIIDNATGDILYSAE